MPTILSNSPYDPNIWLMDPFRNVFTAKFVRRRDDGTVTVRRRDPFGNTRIESYIESHLVPLEMDWHRRGDSAFRHGAIWWLRHHRDGEARASEAYQVYERANDGDGCIIKLRSSTGVLSVPKAVLLTLLQHRTAENTMPVSYTLGNGATRNLYGAYCGNLPFQLPEQQFLSLGDDDPKMLHSFDVERSRGPKVEVKVHSVDIEALNPSEITYQDVVNLRLDRFAEFSRLHGALREPEHYADPYSQANALLKVVAALMKPGYLAQGRPDTMREIPAQHYVPSNIVANIKAGKRGPFLIHPSENEGFLNFYDMMDLVKGRPKEAKIGTVLARIAPDNDNWVKKTGRKLQMDLMPDVFEILTRTTDIIKAYRAGPSSCAAYPLSYYHELLKFGDESEEHLLKYHPTVVYGQLDGDDREPDTALAVLKKGEQVVGRTLVNLRDKAYIRVYPKDNHDVIMKLYEWLTGQGYREDPYGMIGVRLNRVTLPNSAKVVAPYIDIDGQALLDTGDQLWVLGNSASRFISAMNQPNRPRPPAGNHIKFSCAYKSGACDPREHGCYIPLSTCQCGSISLDQSDAIKVYDPETRSMVQQCQRCISQDISRCNFWVMEPGGLDRVHAYIDSRLLVSVSSRVLVKKFDVTQGYGAKIHHIVERLLEGVTGLTETHRHGSRLLCMADEMVQAENSAGLVWAGACYTYGHHDGSVRFLDREDTDCLVDTTQLSTVDYNQMLTSRARQLERQAANPRIEPAPGNPPMATPPTPPTASTGLTLNHLLDEFMSNLPTTPPTAQSASPLPMTRLTLDALLEEAGVIRRDGDPAAGDPEDHEEYDPDLDDENEDWDDEDEYENNDERDIGDAA